MEPRRRNASVARWAALLALIAIAVALPGAALAQAEEAEPAAEQAPPPIDPSQPMGPADELNRGTPRGSMYGFIVATRAGEYEKAARFLDLRRLSPSEQAQGRQLARQLKWVLDRTLWVDWATLSDSNDGTSGDDLPAWQDRLGTIETEAGAVDLLLQRVPRTGDNVRIWKVSAATVAQIPALYDEFGFGPLARWLPEPFFEIQALDLQLWQWIALLVLVPVAWLLALTLSTLVIRVMRFFVGRTTTKLDDRIVHLVEGPVRLALIVGFFALGTLPLTLPLATRDWLRGLESVLIIVAVAWALLRLVDLGALAIRERMLRNGQAGSVGIISPSQKGIKAVIVVLAGLGVLANLGFNVTALLAGFGVGGLAVALAAQKTVENLFGGVTLYADQPVRVGDFCRFGDKIGTVEEIGLRSTRIRTLDRTVVSVPNAEFSSLQIENFAKRDRIWLKTMLGLRYETTPEQMRYVLARLREMLLAHPKITEDPARVRFVGFGAYSLDLEVFAYADTSDFNEFLAIREDVYLRMMDIVAEAGTGFAFPSQTMYVGRDDGLDPQRTKEAEGRVADWRDHERLPFPNFDAARRRELMDSLDYPPEGSPGVPRRSAPPRAGADEHS